MASFRGRRILPSLPASVLLLLFSACGGGSSTPASTVTSVVVIPASSAIAVNGVQTYSATATDASGNSVSGLTFAWSSIATGVATISSTGVATGISGGTTQITATTSNVTSMPATLTVMPKVASVTISPGSATIRAGQTQQFTATAKDVNGNAITGVAFTWSDSFAGIATIDSNGLATAISPGTVMITASLGGVTSPVATLTVTP